MKNLIGALRGMDAAAPQYDATVMELMREVIHHVADEETVLLAAAERVLGERLSELGAKFMKRRLQLMAPHAGEMTRAKARAFPKANLLVLAGALVARPSWSRGCEGPDGRDARLLRELPDDSRRQLRPPGRQEPSMGTAGALLAVRLARLHDDQRRARLLRRMRRDPAGAPARVPPRGHAFRWPGALRRLLREPRPALRQQGLDPLVSSRQPSGSDSDLNGLRRSG
jgi:hypothetical protein